MDSAVTKYREYQFLSSDHEIERVTRVMTPPTDFEQRAMQIRRAMLEQIRTLHSRQAVVQLELIHIVGRV
jgi:hypothetical protein